MGRKSLSDPRPEGSMRSRETQDLTSNIDALRAIPRDPGQAREMDNHLANLAQGAEQLLREHAGMTEELLGVYEQLGILFEVTRGLSNAQQESDLIDLFVDSLSHSYPERPVFCVRNQGQNGQDTNPDSHLEEGWLDSLIKKARERRSAIVEKRPRTDPRVLVEEALVSPVFAGESYVCAIVTTRGPDQGPFQVSDMLLFESLTVFCGDLLRNHRLLSEVREMSVAIVRSLVNAVDQKDPYTSGHSFRVGYFSNLLGRTLNLSGEELQLLQWSALLHDVGKIGIRDDVLKKPGSLTDAEFKHIKEHPVRSHEVVRDVPQLSGALPGILHHHEHFDGSGYPSQLAGEDVPLQARIIQVADVFDALTSTRAYRSAYSWEDALEIMRKEAGKTLDPRLQETFSETLRQHVREEAGGWAGVVARANRFSGLDDSPTPLREER